MIVWIVLGYAVMSIAMFLVYGWDKWRAKHNRWRVRERTLHLLALFCGFPGAIIGQQVFHHKTSKRGFRVLTICIALMHGVGWTMYGLLRSGFLDFI